MEKIAEQTPFTKDRALMVLSIGAGILAFSNVLSVLVRLKSHDFKVPVQYIVNDGSVIQTSSWYSLYTLALVAVFGAAASIFLAHRLYRSNRVFAAGLLVVYLVVAVVSLLVTNALLGLVGRV